MKILKYFVTLLIIIFIAGCVRSLYPLFTEEDLVFKEELIGTWIEKDGKNTWIFERSGEKEYILHHYEAEFEVSSGVKTQGDTATFLVQLGKLNKYYFLDIFPGKPATKVKNGLYNFHLIPVHTFSRVWFDKDTLQLSILNNDWLERMIEKNAFKIPHARSNDQLILTASTEELQQLVIKYAENTKAFPNPAILYRAK
jgi:hypothetical protein